MKKAALLALFTLHSSCAGYFGQNTSQPVMQADRLVSPAIAGGGYLSTDEYNEICPFVYNSRIDGSRWLYFSSDRTGHYQIYRARMLSNGQFQAPERLILSGKESYDLTFPVVYDITNGSEKSNIMVFYSKDDTGGEGIFVYHLGSSNTQVNAFDYNGFTGLGLYYEYDSLGTMTPYLITYDGLRNIQIYDFSDMNLSSPEIIYLPFPALSGNAFDNSYRQVLPTSDERRVLVFEGPGGRLCLSVNDSVDASINIAAEVPDYNGTFSNITPYCDTENGYKVYFASDRNGKGNMDLYRFNTDTIPGKVTNLLLNGLRTVITAPGIFVSPQGYDTNNGQTPETPLRSIDLAISYAGASSLGNIYVAEGNYEAGAGFTYEISNGLINIEYIYNLNLLGGFSQNFLLQNGRSIINGSITNPLLYSMGSSQILISGFEFINHNGIGNIKIMDASSFILTNCVIRNNTCSLNAPVQFSYSSNITIIDTAFISNRSIGSSVCAGLYLFYIQSADISRVTFMHNTGTNLPNLYAQRYDSAENLVAITSCLFNGASGLEQGIMNVGSSNITHLRLISNTFINNKLSYIYVTSNDNLNQDIANPLLISTNIYGIDEWVGNNFIPGL